MIKSSINCEPLLKEEHERQRVILGLCSLLGMKDRPQEVFNHLPQIFNTIITLVKKNAEVRLDSQNDENYITDSSDDEEDEEAKILNFGFAEAEDIWEEDYGNNYSSKLDDVDDIKYFQECMQYLEKEEPSIYSSLIGLVPPDELAVLQQKMNRAIKLLE